MKQFLILTTLAVSLIILSDRSSADESRANKLNASQGCPMLGGLAETIMGERQKNVPMSEMMSRIQKTATFIGFEKLPIDKNGLEKLVVLAYHTPRYYTPSRQQAEIGEFRNRIELLCYDRQMNDD